MTLNDIIGALKVKGLGAVDFMTGETVIESAQLDEDINGDGGLVLSWNSDSGGVIKGGTVLRIHDHDNVYKTFVMDSTYTPTFGSDGLYQWLPKFSEPVALLKKVPYWKLLTMVSQGMEEVEPFSTFVFAGLLRTIIEDIQTFLNATFGTGVWTILLHDDEQQGLANTSVVCKFDGTNIKKAIEEIANQAAEAYDGDGAVNLYYVGNTIHIGLSKAYAADEFYNRFIVLGGTKNMAKLVPAGNAYAAVTQRLSIPAGAYTVDGDNVTVEAGSIIDMRQDKVNEAPFTRYLVYNDIYPKLDMKIKSATSRLCYLLDENGEKISDGNGGYKMYCKWYIMLTLDGETPYEIDTRYIIQDKPLSLLFQSGPLTGREFELVALSEGTHEKEDDDVYDGHTVPAGVTEYRIIIKADGDVLLPGLPPDYDGGGLCPQVGNMVTLVNVAIEDEYRDAAREKLLSKAYAAARLIYSGKVPSISEERTAPDIITGKTGEKRLGDAIGDTSDGYIVTSISTDMMTGEQTYTYGTFKPRGILSSAIDEIGSLSLTGGEATFSPLVDVRDEGVEQVIYVGIDNGSGNTSGLTGGTSQSSTTVLQNAGGYKNIRTVYNKVAMVEQMAKEADVLATLIQEVYADSKDEIRALATISNVTQYEELDFTGYSVTRLYSLDGDTLYKEGQESTNTQLKGAFLSAKEVVGSVVVKLFNTTSIEGVTPTKYDLCAVPVDFTNRMTTIEGGVQGWMHDGTSWQVILETTTAIIDNLGNAINLVVFGSQDTTAEAAGMLTTKNFVTLFSQAITAADNTVLAQAMLTLGIRYSITIDSIDYDVEYDIQNGKWIYSDTEEDVEEEYLDKIVPSSFVGMSADDIDFTAGTFTIDANHIVISGNYRLDTFVSGEVGRINNAITTATSGMVTENNFVTIFSEIVSPTDGNAYTAITKAMLGMGIKYHYVGDSVFDVEWDGDGQNWLASSDHEIISDSDIENIQPYSYAGLTADVIDFKGKTITLGGSGNDKLTIDGGNVLVNANKTLSFTSGNGGKIDFVASDVEFTANKTVFKDSNGNDLALFSNNKLNLTSSNCTMNISGMFTVNAEEINFVGQTVNMDATTVLNLNVGTLNLNAEKITWKGRDVITHTWTDEQQQEHTETKFSVANNGDVTMNNLTANNATLSGTLLSTGEATSIIIDASEDGGYTCIKMNSLIDNETKEVLSLSLEQRDEQDEGHEGVVNLYTTDPNHSERRAELRPQRLLIGGNQYTTVIKPRHYWIFETGEAPDYSDPEQVIEGYGFLGRGEDAPKLLEIDDNAIIISDSRGMKKLEIDGYSKEISIYGKIGNENRARLNIKQNQVSWIKDDGSTLSKTWESLLT